MRSIEELYFVLRWKNYERLVCTVKKLTTLTAVVLFTAMILVCASASADVFFFVDMGEPLKEVVTVKFSEEYGYETMECPAMLVEDGLPGFVAFEFSLPDGEERTMEDIIGLSYKGLNGHSPIEAPLYLAQLYGDELVFLSLKTQGLDQTAKSVRVAGACWPQYNGFVTDETEMLLLAPADSSVLPEMLIRLSNASVIGASEYAIDETTYNVEQVLPATHSKKDAGFSFVLTIIPEETYFETMIAGEN